MQLERHYAGRTVGNHWKRRCESVELPLWAVSRRRRQSNLTTAPPDHSGYSYTPTNWPAEANAFPFQAKRNAFASYGDTVDTVDAGNAITSLSITNAYRVTTHGVGGEHDTGGADRRISTAPVVDCAEWVSSQTVPILGWVCVLMLHPISSPGEIVRMEFLGSATTLGSPCTTYGIAGDGWAAGPGAGSLMPRTMSSKTRQQGLALIELGLISPCSSPSPLESRSSDGRCTNTTRSRKQPAMVPASCR